MTANASRHIIYLTLPPNAPSYRFRVHQYLNEIQKHGFKVTVKEIPGSMLQKIRLFMTLHQYDIVFLQKRLLQAWFVWLIRRKARVLVYDFDDAVLYRSSAAKNKHSINRRRRFRNITRSADIVVAGNRYLKGLAQPYARKVVVIPTGIDVQRYLPSPRVTGLATIGWIGSRSSLMFLKNLIDPINALYRQYPAFQLKVVCDDFIQGFDCPVVNKLWREEDEIADIQSFDIGLLPMLNDHWTKGKCALKLLQYMSCALPSVSSVTDAVTSIIDHGQNGFLADRPEQWCNHMLELLESPDLRAKMGKQARMSITGKFDIKSIGRQYVAAFESVMNNSGR